MLLMKSIGHPIGFALALSVAAVAAVRGADDAPVVLPPAASRPVTFARDIKPIFDQRCLDCHNEQKHKGGIRLDRKDDILKGGDSGGPDIIPGQSEKSLLIKLVAGVDPDQVMPPKGERLSADQIGLLRAWIDQGAVWPEELSAKTKIHWAYVAPQRPPLPKVSNRGWVRNPVDAFVLDRLTREKLKPSTEALRAVLMRRVSLDLIGLPPTRTEVEAFEKDRRPDAYERAVDRLLASPRYGERWARPWLDLARYADTQGYEKDNRRTMWPYRDWVIEALNRDLPFDQFTIEQIAGDMLPNASTAQKVATGFHRNTMTNTEGGTDDEEFRYEAVVDRVNTTFSVWMGTTLNCAQCHNHKYDPFTTAEYYRIMAFLNNTEDSDKDDERPTLKVFRLEQEVKLAELRKKQTEAEKAVADAVAAPEFTRSLAAWEKEAAATRVKWMPLDVLSVKSDNGTGFTNPVSGELLSTNAAPATDSYTVAARTGLHKVSGFRLDAVPDKSLPGKGPGRSADGNIILTTFRVTAGDIPIKLSFASADFSQEGYPVVKAIDGDNQTGWAWAPQFGRAHHAVFGANEPIAVTDETVFLIRLEHQNKEWAQHSLGRFRLSVTDAVSVTNSVVPEDIGAILAIESTGRDQRQKDRLIEYYRQISPMTKPLVAAATAAKKTADDFFGRIPISSIMIERRDPRKTFRHIRGAYLQKGDEVTAGTPISLHPFPANETPDRLGFARWIVSTNNPLTARVTVNRMWEACFGRGIVETAEDFGTMGEKPSHPELLDWLARELMQPTVRDSEQHLDEPWSLKHLLRVIVTSATYRQSSKVTPALLDQDPYNRLFARGPSVRLEAEMIRDQALALAGLLSTKMGGPSVMPPQPDSVWQMVYSGDKWETSTGDDKYRRGVYTFWRRTSPYPSMVSFDAPSREFCVIRRARSNTPLQALTLLNDPVYLEAAQALARRVVQETPGASIKQRVEYAFRLAVCRTPSPRESARLTALFQEKQHDFTTDLVNADKFATSRTGPLPAGLSPADAAAWTLVANVLLNLDEVITKG